MRSSGGSLGMPPMTEAFAASRPVRGAGRAQTSLMFIAGSKVLQRPHHVGDLLEYAAAERRISCRLEHLCPADRARSSTKKTAKALWRGE